MCGIVGYVGKRPVQDLLLEGLTRLEYRGYDSAGISMIAGEAIDSVRAVGNLEHLREAVSARVDEESGGVATATRTATTGIGHTRWATHGRVNEENAHPHFDTADRVHIVVNGIVENYLSMRERLTDMGAVFTSETDAEVIAHLIAHHLATGSLLEAVRAAYAELDGHFAFVAMTLDEPETLVGARKECPLIVGRGEGETFFASAIPAFLRETRRVQYIENGEIVEITPEGTSSCCPTAPSSSARSWRSTGTRRPPRRAASRPSCSRRSTSRPTRWPRRSPTAPSVPTASTSTTSAPSTRTSCAASSGSSSSPAARATTPASSGATRSRSGRASPWRWTSPPSTATAIRSSGRATWSSGSRSRARRPTRWRRCASRASAAPPCSR